MSKILLNDEQSPYICVPITGKTKTEIFQQLEEILHQAPDIIEWRADFFANLADIDQTLQIVHEIKARTEVPLLFTIRAEHEGGEKIMLATEEKVSIINDICRKTAVDLVDFETSNGEKFVNSIKDVTKENNKQLILSYHNFTKTPENSELIERAQQARTLGADIVKFAVMPHSKDDVFRLLEVTREIDALLDVPVISMSMGEIGALSRVIGWAYGSTVTFGVGVESSAPGQVPVGKLRKAINHTQQLVPNWNS